MNLWMVIKSYGVSGLREYIRKHVKMAKDFEAFLCTNSKFEVMAPRNFAMVCFRVSPSALATVANKTSDEKVNRLNEQLLESLNGTGHVFMTHTVIEGMHMIRVAIGATLTEDKHVSMLWDMVQEHANTLLAKYACLK